MSNTKHKMNTVGLNQIARVLTPAAMVIFLTMEIVDSQQGIGWWIYPVAIAALFTSVGIEAWGMMSGANVEKSWLLNRSKLSSSIQLVLYVGVTMWLLKSNQTLIALPVVAALVYVSAALYDSLNRHQVKQDTDERQSLAIQLRQQEAAAQREHEARLKQMELDAQAKIALETKHEESATAVKLARIEAKKRAEVKTDSGTLSDTSKTDWRTLSDNQRSHIARLTPEQIISQYNVSSKTAGRWIQKAGQFQPEMSTNGHAK